MGFRRYSGKGQSELKLLRQMWGLFAPGDVLLADRLICSWLEMATLKQRGIDPVNSSFNYIYLSVIGLRSIRGHLSAAIRRKTSQRLFLSQAC